MTSQAARSPSRLGVLGVTTEAEQAYASLLRGAHLASNHPHAAELLAAELAADVAGALVPLPIDNAFESWRRRRAAEEVAAKAATTFFADLYQDYAEGSRDVTVIRGGEAVSRTALDLQATAQNFVHTMERGPFWAGPNPTVGEGQQAASGRGVVYRTIYQADLLNSPSLLDVIRDSMAMGEDARSYDGIPIRLMIADDIRALLVLPQPPSPDNPLKALAVDGLLVEQPNFVQALSRLFDAFWGRGTPLHMLAPDRSADSAAASEDILAMLTLGMTDASIARALNVSERTVLRRVSALLEKSGVRTRFQLGLKVARSEQR